MNARHFCSILAAAVFACLLTAGCDDSKNPLSSPQESQRDAPLAGVWRLEDDAKNVTYYHIGPLGGNAPKGLMRVVSVHHTKDGELGSTGQLVLFPTKLGKDTYLNVAGTDESQLKRVREEGWAADAVEAYFLLKYRLDGDTLLFWTMDLDAKREAIRSGKVQGEIVEKKHWTTVRFTDTTENVARFVAEAGDELFSTDALRLQRVR